ncbi:PDR/VanB family oxidoreductase [Prauserella halophila]|uniref:PDR/VanB family oxidoreductase n=1 Tax=Prauserella halophila TaxID=185641 RepID=A0ABN1WID2_9PSEU|nr:PDR/VanB family oxidoreductase [Prauserella halophila]MCP2238052.1 vanillate O-demethylase ferredoxin subunit [Prauserella halophila]
MAMDTIPVRVADVVDETADIRSLRLTRTDGAEFPAYEAGAHVDVVGPTGLVRQYSLCGRPSDRSSLHIAVKREPDSRGGSQALHTVSAGDSLEIGQPRNLLTLAPDADRHLLVAGGIGVTPLLGMAHELAGRGAEFELHYFARSREEAAFADHLESLAEFRGRVHLRFGTPRDKFPAVLADLAPELTPESHVYTCGPDGFMTEVVTAFAPVVGEQRVHVEHFVAAEADTGEDDSFTVELDTGETFAVPAGQSILSVLGENGIEVFKSCEEGICGSCVSGVLEGTPDHRDRCLSASDRQAGDQMALCVSRALTDKLVIELY